MTFSGLTVLVLYTCSCKLRLYKLICLNLAKRIETMPRNANILDTAKRIETIKKEADQLWVDKNFSSALQLYSEALTLVHAPRPAGQPKLSITARQKAELYHERSETYKALGRWEDAYKDAIKCCKGDECWDEVSEKRCVVYVSCDVYTASWTFFNGVCSL